MAKSYKEKLLAAGVNAPAADMLDNPAAYGNSNIVTAKVNNLTGGIAIISKLTQAQYDALAVKDDSTLYVIVG